MFQEPFMIVVGIRSTVLVEFLIMEKLLLIIMVPGLHAEAQSLIIIQI